MFISSVVDGIIVRWHWNLYQLRMLFIFMIFLIEIDQKGSEISDIAFIGKRAPCVNVELH